MTWEEERSSIILWASEEYDAADGTFDEVCRVTKRVYDRLIALATEMYSQYGDKETV